MTQLPGTRLEQYSLTHPQEVLLVKAVVDEQPDEVAIYKGFSSSLVRPTPADLSVPILPPTATIISIDRLEAPFDPAMPRHIELEIAWAEFEQRLTQLGI